MAFVSRFLAEPNCRFCPLHYYPKVPPEGELDASLALIGEGPGYNEERVRRPFIGPAGQMLDWLLRRLKERREDLWISNAACCMPHHVVIDEVEDLVKSVATTRKESVFEHCRTRLLKELAIVKPKVVIAAGAFAMESLTGAQKIMNRHGALFPVDLSWLAEHAHLGLEQFKKPGLPLPNLEPDNVTYVIPTLHPAHLIRGEVRKTQSVLYVMEKAFRIAREGPRDEGFFEVISPYSPGGARYNIDKLKVIVDRLIRLKKPIAIDFETTAADARHADMTIIGVGSNALKLGVAVSWLAWDRRRQIFVECWSPDEKQEIWELFARLWAARLEMWMWNMNFDITVGQRYWPKQFQGPFYDGIHLHWLVQPDTPHKLGWACLEVLDAPAWKPDFRDKEKAGASTDRDGAVYNAGDDLYTARVIPYLQKRVVERKNGHLVDRQRRVTDLARKAYYGGIPVNLDKLEVALGEYEVKRAKSLHKMRAALAPELQDLNEYMHSVRCRRARASATNRGVRYKEPKRVVVTDEDGDNPFSPTSPDQATWYLYNFLNLPVTRWTKGGKDGTNRKPAYSYKGVLNEMGHPLVKEFVDFSDYLDPLKRLREIRAAVDPTTGRMHPPWNTTGMAGTRWVSKPNCQNLYKDIKKLLEAEPGYVWVGADAAQLELRILACLAGIPKLLELFNKPPFNEDKEEWKKYDPAYDAHSLVATLVYGEGFTKASFEDKKKLRTLVKRVVYGMNYGAHPPKIQLTLLEDKNNTSALRAQLAGEEGLRRVEAIYNGFHAYIPEVRQWAASEVAKVRARGYQVIPPFSRRRYWPVMEVEEPKLRNTPIQLCAGDIFNDMVCSMDDEVERNGWSMDDAYMAIHLHDACYWHVRKELAKPMVKLINRHFDYWLAGPRGHVHIYGQAGIGPTAADVG